MADNPIDLNRIFDFKDTDPLDQVIIKTQQFNTVLEQMLQTAQKSSQGIISSMQAIQKSVDSLEQEMVQADATTKKGQETIANGAATTAKAVSQNEEYKKSLSDLNTTIKLLQDQIDKLSESNKKIPKDNDTASNSLADLKKQLKDATDAYLKMGDSTDAAIKQKSLKNVTDLNTQVRNGQQVLNDAKKASDLASGSYNDLALKVANATKQLKAMEGGVGSNSEQFKNLQKFVADGNEKLKTFDATIGVANRNVGNYTESIEKAIPTFKQLNPQLFEAGEAIQAFGKKALQLLLNPVVLVIAAIVAGLALMKKALDTFTEKTIEGADRATKLGDVWGTISETITGNLKKWGKAISDFLESTLIILTQVIPMTDEFKKKLDINTQIAIIQNELKKEEIKLIVESAQLQLEKEEELNKARDKTNRSLQDRYESLQKANILIKEEIALKTQSAQKELDIIALQFKKIGITVNGETDINELMKNQIVTQKKSYEQVEQLANAQKKLIDIQKEQFEGARRRQALENQLLDEQIKFIQDAMKEERDVQVKINEEIIKSDEAKNARIIANQSSTLNERVNAEIRNAQDFIALNDKQTSDELVALREKGLQEIILDKQTNDNIIAQAGTNLKLRAQLVLDAKNKEFDINERFQNEVKLLIEAGTKREEEIYKKSAENIIKITLDKAKQVSEAETSQSRIGKDEALIALNNSLKNREISIVQFQKRRAKIEAQGDIEVLNSEIDGLERQKEILKTSEQVQGQFAQDILKIDQQIADKKKEISDKSTKITEQNLKEIRELEKQFANQSLDTIKTLGDNATQARIDALNNQLAAFQSAHDQEIALAGDNATAKAQIDKTFAEQQARIQKEEAKLKHDQAVRDRQIDMAKIIINTAVAISEHLANPIAAALIGALGALELAKVASTPIPAYFRGTDWSKEGLALVAEKGPEIGIDRSGDIAIYEKPQLTYLNEGTKILTAEQSDPILKKMDTKHMDLISHQLIDIGIRDIKAGQSLNREIISKLDTINDTTKRNKPAQVNYAKVGAVVYEFKKEEETYLKRTKALSMGSWSK